jgi:nicotinamidase-related amidase
MDKHALIILDLQNCFINRQTKFLPKKIKQHIKKKKYDFIIFSKFINSERTNFVKKLNWNKCNLSPETDIVSEFFDISLKNHIFEKNTYSIFKSIGFVDFLNQNKVSKLYFCGLDLDACILASAFEAFDLGFDFEILYDLSDSSANTDINDSAKKIIHRNLHW